MVTLSNLMSIQIINTQLILIFLTKILTLLQISINILKTNKGDLNCQKLLR